MSLNKCGIIMTHKKDKIDTFKDLLNIKDKPTVVVWTGECSYCQSIKPLFESIKNKCVKNQNVNLIYVNKESSQDLFDFYQITHTPTISLYYNNLLISRVENDNLDLVKNLIALTDYKESSIELYNRVSNTISSDYLEIYLIRHSLSCANLVNSYCKSKLKQKMKAVKCPDPLLSDWPFFKANGAERTKLTELRKTLYDLNSDIVLSSTLIRAMETAHALFPNRRVYVVPFMKEQEVGTDNVPLSIKEQQKILYEEYKDIDWIDYKYIQNESETNRNLSNYEKFINKVIIPLITNNISLRRVAIVTHSHLMKKLFQKMNIRGDKFEKILNNSVYHIKYNRANINIYNPISVSLIDEGFNLPQNWNEQFEDRCQIQKSCYELINTCDKK